MSRAVNALVSLASALACLVAVLAVPVVVASCAPAPPGDGDDDNDDDDPLEPVPDAPDLTWSELTYLPTASTFGGGYVGATLLDGNLYVLAGDYAPELPTSLDIYDFDADAWTAAPPLPSTTRMGAMLLGADQRVFAIGGYESETAERLRDNFVFDPATSSWTEAAPMRLGRFEHAGVAIGDTLFIFGGDDGRGLRYENSAEAYDVATDTWRDIAPMPHQRKGGAAALVDGKVWLIGGIDADQYLRIIDIYDPSTDSWSTADVALRETRFGVAVAPLGSRIVVAGGLRYGGPDVGEERSTSVELIDPADAWSSYADDFNQELVYGVGMPLDATSALIVGLYASSAVRRVSFD